MANAMQAAIASSVNDWLQQHPSILQLFQILIWMSSHPILSLVFLLLLLAIAWNLIKALGYFLEMIGRSLMLAPLMVAQFLFKSSVKSLSHVGNLAIKQLTSSKKPELLALPPANSPVILSNKEQRLAEISHRLEALQKEQNELLQEVATLLHSDEIDIKVP